MISKRNVDPAKKQIIDCSEQNNQSFPNTTSLLKRSKLIIGKKKHQY